MKKMKIGGKIQRNGEDKVLYNYSFHLLHFISAFPPPFPIKATDVAIAITAFSLSCVNKFETTVSEVRAGEVEKNLKKKEEKALKKACVLTARA